MGKTNSTFNIQIGKIIVDYLPPKLRKVGNLQFVYSLLTSIRSRLGWFEGWTFNRKRDLLHNGQAILLEHYLNKYSFADDYIYIIDGTERYEPFILFRDEETIADYYYDNFLFKDPDDEVSSSGYKNYIFSEVDIGNEEYDFGVIVSQNDWNNIEKRNNIRSIVNRYKAAGFYEGYFTYN